MIFAITLASIILINGVSSFYSESKYSSTTMDFKEQNSRKIILQQAPFTLEISETKANEIVISEKFSISFEYLPHGSNSDPSLRITVVMKCSGYIGINFSSKMTESDMIVIQWKNSSSNINLSNVTVQDMWSTSQTTPSNDEFYGGKNDILNLRKHINEEEKDDTKADKSSGINKFITLTFERYLNTGDKYDTVLPLNTLLEVSFAWLEDDLAYHNQNLQFSNLFIDSLYQKVFINKNNHEFYRNSVLFYHGVIMTFLWTVLTPISILIVSYLKHRKLAMFMHISLSSMVSIGTVVMVLIVMLYSPSSILDNIQQIVYSEEGIINTLVESPRKAHIALGLLVAMILVIQHLIGFVLYLKVYVFNYTVKNNSAEYAFTDNKEYKTLRRELNSVRLIKNIHWFFGVLLSNTVPCVLAIGNYILFYQESCTTQTCYYKVILSLSVASYLFYIFLYLIKFSNTNKQIQLNDSALSTLSDKMIKKKQKSIDSLQNTINSFKVASENNTKLILHLERKEHIVYYENLILNIKELVGNHPGGNNVIYETRNTDITRYINGTVPSDFSIPETVSNCCGSSITFGYQHNKNTVDYLVMNYSIGRIISRDCFVINTNGNSTHCLMRRTGVERVAESIYAFHFSPYSERDKTQFAQCLPGLDFAGKHFTVESLRLKKTRIYSTCLILNKKTKDIHTLLLQNLQLLGSIIKENSNNRTTFVFNNNEVNSLIRKDLKDIGSVNVSSFKDNLTLFIKVYNSFDNRNNQNTMLTSELLPEDMRKNITQTNPEVSNVKDDSLFNIKGPFGFSLSNLSYLDSHYYLFAGGTGVFCVLDFVAFTLRYMAYRIRRKVYIKYCEDSNSQNDINSNCNTEDTNGVQGTELLNKYLLIFQEEDFSFVTDNFKLTFFASFKAKENAPLLDFCFLLEEIDRLYGLDIFRFKPRFSNEDSFKWDQQYLESNIQMEELMNIENKLNHSDEEAEEMIELRNDNNYQSLNVNSSSLLTPSDKERKEGMFELNEESNEGGANISSRNNEIESGFEGKGLKPYKYLDKRIIVCGTSSILRELKTEFYRLDILDKVLFL